MAYEPNEIYIHLTVQLVYLKSILQDHRVSLMKLMRSNYQQGIDIFRWTVKENETFFENPLVYLLPVQTLVTFLGSLKRRCKLLNTE